MSRVNYRDSSAAEPSGGPGGFRAWLDDRPQLPYLLPFVGYVALMSPGTFGHFAGIDWQTLWYDWHPYVYASENVLAGVLLWLLWHHYTPIRWSKLSLGVAAGLVGTVLWIGIGYGAQWIGLSHLPEMASVYNPDAALHSTWARWAYLVVRVAGPTLVVPVMEELFFRDFLMRALIRGIRFDDVPVGTFTWFSLIGMSLLFGVNHGVEWPAGIAYGLLMGVLLIRTKSLGACIVAHGVTNFTLYLYAIYFGAWQFM